MPQPHTDSLITLKELATYLKVTEKTIYNMIEANKIPFLRIGKGEKGDYRFNLNDVLPSLQGIKQNKT